MKKSSFICALALIALSLFVVGCSSDSKESTSSKKTSSDGTSETVKKHVKTKEELAYEADMDAINANFDAACANLQAAYAAFSHDGDAADGSQEISGIKDRLIEMYDASTKSYDDSTWDQNDFDDFYARQRVLMDGVYALNDELDETFQSDLWEQGDRLEKLDNIKVVLNKLNDVTDTFGYNGTCFQG